VLSIFEAIDGCIRPKHAAGLSHWETLKHRDFIAFIEERKSLETFCLLVGQFAWTRDPARIRPLDGLDAGIESILSNGITQDPKNTEAALKCRPVIPLPQARLVESSKLLHIRTLDQSPRYPWIHQDRSLGIQITEHSQWSSFHFKPIRILPYFASMLKSACYATQRSILLGERSLIPTTTLFSSACDRPFIFALRLSISWIQLFYKACN
jgi:hypothetical protein